MLLNKNCMSDTPTDSPKKDLSKSAKGNGRFDRSVIVSGRTLFTKIDCYVVLTDKKNRARPKILGHVKIKVGVKEFTIWRGNRQRRYRIDYEQLIEGTKSYLYFTELQNAVGALSFYEYPAEKYQDELDSRNSELMLYDGAVEHFQGRKGIPALYLVILGIGMMIGIIGMVVLVQMYLSEARLADSLENQVANLKTQITTLQSNIPTNNNSNQGGGIIR